MSVVELALRLAGDVSSFTPSVRTEMKSAIAARADVDPSAVTVTVTSGSVIVGVRVLTPTVMATSVQSAMASATSSPSSATAMLASVTGVSIAVLAVVTSPTITDVASPPPQPTFSPTFSPSPSPPPQRPPGALNSAVGEYQLSDYEFRKEGDDGGGHGVEQSGDRASSAGGRVTGSSSGPSGSMDLSIQL
ncbi:hypothetical protein Ctob_003629 [Chrysochromulina tobinii]|uniref:Uncharacterized protein n=1 Tax=Chrysochromulina tobinii TaxID=1460289 RepID=A0A0M0JGR1_9EUKA|nr:hypothetical protein Ctob_003629 [Chrysochromulina tobinii]|eukprot:KOO25645.1 hypothetical protein Ctob_003629 [Chrysochromulina sp. CCMP291]